jgi:hypothetical protein
MSLHRAFLLLLAGVLVSDGCSSSNNLLMGHVRAKLGTHETNVTDCYRTSVPQPRVAAGGYKWEPCGDAVIAIDNEQLTVNGKDYGHLNAGDSILVDHGVVSVGSSGAAQRAGS